MLEVTNNGCYSQKNLSRGPGVSMHVLPQAYGPYGYSFVGSSLMSSLGFNGQYLSHVAGLYLLGNGYRGYSSKLMRFSGPDSMSPFQRGGINSYAYCQGDPINLQDPSGRYPTAVAPPPRGSNYVLNSGLSKRRLLGRQRSGSMESLISRPMSGEVPEGWDLIGYHGSSRANAPSLEGVLKPKHSGTFAGQKLGKGFYLAPSANNAASYAWQHEKIGQQPQLYEVYVENANRLRSGRDYSMNLRGMEHKDFFRFARHFGVMDTLFPDSLEVVIRPRVYFQVEVRMAQLRDKVVYPRSHEAPF